MKFKKLIKTAAVTCSALIISVNSYAAGNCRVDFGSGEHFLNNGMNTILQVEDHTIGEWIEFIEMDNSIPFCREFGKLEEAVRQANIDFNKALGYFERATASCSGEKRELALQNVKKITRMQQRFAETIEDLEYLEDDYNLVCTSVTVRSYN